MKSKYKRVLGSICAAVMLIAALSVGAFAATSVADQMAANSAAWHVANAAGDKATCDALHAANKKLAAQAASGGGSASYNSSSGTWNITTSSGSNISSSSSSNGKQTTSTYTTTTSSGRTSSTSVDSYSSSSISSYKSNGGTNQGLQTAYNNDAYNVSSTGSYGNTNAVSSAAAEAAVAKELLGLTNAQAAKLQADLEAAKQDYINADNAYKAAVASGDAAAIAAAQAQKDAAHDAAQATRASYNYTGDSEEYNDGGYYDGTTKSKTTSGSGGGFFITNITATYKITASCNEGGTISPSGEVNVKKGESQSFTITPNTGYKIKSVTVDSSNQGTISTYTFSNVTAAHTITAEFEKLTYNISASCGTGGTISPSGTTSVAYGSSKTYTIQPMDGYEIADVIVDGKSVGAVTSYTFSNIAQAHTIKATFRANGKIAIDDIDLTDALDADLSGNSIKSGYGIFANVGGSHSGVTNAKMVMTYNFGSGNKTVTLQETSAGNFEFPKNSSSPSRQRCVYIPVETKDGTYTLTLTFTATKADGTALTETKTSTITVKGSMYEDDFTGDS